MQVIGLCRFSYPAIGGFQVEHDSLAERIAYLYQPARLEERFRLFEGITLPALRAQSDPDFDLLILVGDSLPAAARTRLDGLIRDLPQARILSRPPAEHRPMMQQLLQETRRSPALPCLQFRMDDDDAVAVDFVARLRALAQDTETLLRQHRTVGLDFNTGYLGRASATGMDLLEVTRPLLTAGLGLYVRGGNRQSIMNFGHHKLAQKMPVISINTPAMFLRTHNGFNDARQSGRARPEALLPATPEEGLLLQERFGIDLDHIRQLFSAT